MDMASVPSLQASRALLFPPIFCFSTIIYWVVQFVSIKLFIFHHLRGVVKDTAGDDDKQDGDGDQDKNDVHGSYLAFIRGNRPLW